MTTRKKLFISYRRKSWNDASRLYDILSKLLDIEIFMDFKGIDRDDFETAILTHLQASDVVMVVVTELTFAADRIHRDDDWVRREIREALLLKKPIVLACVDGLFPPADLPEDIRPVRNKEGKRLFAEFFDAGSQQLADHIATIGGIPFKAIAPSNPPPVAPPNSTTNNATTTQDRRDKIEALIEAEDYAQAVFELEALIDSGFKSSRFWNASDILQEMINLRDTQARRDQMQADYAELVRAARIAKTLGLKQQVIENWEKFLVEFPDFSEADDHAGLRAKLLTASPKPPASAPSKPAITAEQQRLIDIMLDWQHYDPIKRAEAGRQLAEIGDPRRGVGLRPDGLPDFVWCEVPGGKAKLGGDKDAYQSLPEQIVDLPTFYIAKYPLTYLPFQSFLDADDGFANGIWWQGLAARQTEAADQGFNYANHPRENVSWYDSIAYCRWLSSKLGYDITLPTEQQWEKAARVTDGRFFPWGNNYETGYANIDETRKDKKVGNYFLKTTAAVGLYPQGKSPYEVLDLSGNVWEWTLTEFKSIKSNEFSNTNNRTLRGGSWLDDLRYARAANRLGNSPDFRFDDVGFRVVCVRPYQLAIYSVALVSESERQRTSLIF